MLVTESHTGSGLWVAENTVTHESIAALLREQDPRLRLVPQVDETRRCLLWQVWAYNGPDRDAEHVCSWTTPDGEPLPLGSQLLEKVRLLDRRTVGEAPDPRKMNEKHRELVKREKRRKLDDISDDHRPYVDRGRRSVSMGARPTRQPADHI